MWAVALTYAPTGDIPELEVDGLMDRLEETIDAFVFVDRPGTEISVTVHVDAPGIMEAGPIAFEQVRKVIGDPWPVAAVEIVEEWLYEERAPGIPDLVSTADVAEMLGVQRQRVHQLRSHPLFPDPAFEPAAGPFWLQEDIEEFIAKWDRKPGRPRKASKAS